MSDYTRNLTFHVNDLGSEGALVLLFEAPYGAEGGFPIAWKVIPFQAGGYYEVPVTYNNKPRFGRPQVAQDIVSDAVGVNLNPNERTDLTENNGLFQFSVPQFVSGIGGAIQCRNLTNAVQEIGIDSCTGIDQSFSGFDSGSWTSNITFYWDGVGSGSTISAQFKPVLKAYVTTDYKQNAIIRRPIEFPVIWQQDLSTLPTNSSFTFSRDPGTGDYTLVRDDN
ncbi:hypothetical protein Clacol_010196 [Clathrus columnatus]|uniref:Uncharacterized protein n=1 Tax=Clathrus columnatus TaxID=1419009 RepID=A0AAV5AML0_9AGAM|nr:hypothetical protein Clacol_010196 [Clathrus columnatus]